MNWIGGKRQRYSKKKAQQERDYLERIRPVIQERQRRLQYAHAPENAHNSVSHNIPVDLMGLRNLPPKSASLFSSPVSYADPVNLDAASSHVLNKNANAPTSFQRQSDAGRPGQSSHFRNVMPSYSKRPQQQQNTVFISSDERSMSSDRSGSASNKRRYDSMNHLHVADGQFTDHPLYSAFLKEASLKAGNPHWYRARKTEVLKEIQLEQYEAAKRRRIENETAQENLRQKVDQYLSSSDLSFTANILHHDVEEKRSYEGHQYFSPTAAKVQNVCEKANLENALLLSPNSKQSVTEEKINRKIGLTSSPLQKGYNKDSAIPGPSTVGLVNNYENDRPVRFRDPSRLTLFHNITPVKSSGLTPITGRRAFSRGAAATHNKISWRTIIHAPPTNEQCSRDRVAEANQRWKQEPTADFSHNSPLEHIGASVMEEQKTISKSIQIQKSVRLRFDAASAANEELPSSIADIGSELACFGFAKDRNQSAEVHVEETVTNCVQIRKTVQFRSTQTYFDEPCSSRSAAGANFESPSKEFCKPTTPVNSILKPSAAYSKNPRSPLILGQFIDSWHCPVCITANRPLANECICCSRPQYSPGIIGGIFAPADSRTSAVPSKLYLTYEAMLAQGAKNRERTPVTQDFAFDPVEFAEIIDEVDDCGVLDERLSSIFGLQRPTPVQCDEWLTSSDEEHEHSQRNVPLETSCDDFEAILTEF